MASGLRQAMVVVSSQEHWSHFLSVLGPLTSDPLGSKQACHVTAGGRCVSFYHAALAEEAEEKEAGFPNSAHTFLLLIRGGCYSGRERSLLGALVSSFGAEAVGRLAVVSLDDSQVGGTPDHDLLELMDACQGRYCRMTPSTVLDGLDVLLHLLHFMPMEKHHLTEAKRSNRSSSSDGDGGGGSGGGGGGEDMKTLRHQELQAEEETFRLWAEQQEQRRAAELHQLTAKHAEERQQEEVERRCHQIKRGLEKEVVRRSHTARLQQQLSITPGTRTSAAAAGGGGEDGPADSSGGEGGGGGAAAAAGGRWICCCWKWRRRRWSCFCWKSWRLRNWRRCC